MRQLVPLFVVIDARDEKGASSDLLETPLADEARFELAVGFPTTVFKTVSLDRSDTHPVVRATL